MLMTKNTSTGSFDIILSMEEISGRDNVCLSFGAGLFRKLGWSSGDWLSFDVSCPGFISLEKMAAPSESLFYARKIKLNAGFYKVCFYSRLYNFPKDFYLSKEKAMFNLESRKLTLEIPAEYWQVATPPKVQELRVEDIAAAFRKL